MATIQTNARAADGDGVATLSAEGLQRREEIARFLRAIPTIQREVVGPSDRPASTEILRLREPGVQWPTIPGPPDAHAPAGLFVRPCYGNLLHLAIDLLAHSSAEFGGPCQLILTGSAGVGKRAFLSYVLYRLRTHRAPPRVVLDLPGFFGLVHANGDVEEGQRGRSFHEALASRQVFYLCDAASEPAQGPLLGPDHRAMSIIVRPAILERTAAFEAQHLCRRLHMPLWSAAELESCRRGCFPGVSPRTHARLWQWWGGSIRWTLATPPEVAERQFARAVGRLSLDDALAVARNEGHVEAEWEWHEGHGLLHLETTSDDTFHLLTTRLCSAEACAALLEAPPTHQGVLQFIHDHGDGEPAVKTLHRQVERVFINRVLGFYFYDKCTKDN